MADVILAVFGIALVALFVIAISMGMISFIYIIARDWRKEMRTWRRRR